MRHHADETRVRFRLELPEQFLFARRQKAANGHETLPCLFQNRGDFGGVFLRTLSQGQSHVEQEGRGKQGEVPHARLGAAGWEDRVTDGGVADETFGMPRPRTLLRRHPEGAR